MGKDLAVPCAGTRDWWMVTEEYAFGDRRVQNPNKVITAYNVIMLNKCYIALRDLVTKEINYNPIISS